MGYENHLWHNWIIEGPEIGFVAELDDIVGIAGPETGLRIKGIIGDICSGFFGFAELERYGFSPNHIAGIDDLARIMNNRSSRTSPI